MSPKQRPTATKHVRKHDAFVIKKNIKKSHQKVIVVAGMRHSGSTALFNIVRLALEEAGVDYYSCYSEHHDCVQKITDSGLTGLVKVHELRDDIVKIATVLLTTRRDLRDTVASAVRRRFPLLTKIGGPIEYAKYNRELHDCWLNICDYRFIYEDFILDPIDCIRNVVNFLGFSSIDENMIQKLVSNLPVDNYKTTLLSPTHITDPERKLNYLDTLDFKTISKIEDQNSQWLTKYGYVSHSSFD